MGDRCKRKMSWCGQCSKEAVEGESYCKEHLNEECRVCGKQVTCECSSASSLVCGSPLCDDCKCPNHKEKGV